MYFKTVSNDRLECMGCSGHLKNMGLNPQIRHQNINKEHWERLQTFLNKAENEANENTLENNTEITSQPICQ